MMEWETYFGVKFVRRVLIGGNNLTRKVFKGVIFVKLKFRKVGQWLLKNLEHSPNNFYSGQKYQSLVCMHVTIQNDVEIYNWM